MTRSPLIGGRDGPISQLMVKSSATLVKKRVEGAAFPYPQGNSCLIAGVNRVIATMGLAIDTAPGARATLCLRRWVCAWCVAHRGLVTRALVCVRIGRAGSACGARVERL